MFLKNATGLSWKEMERKISRIFWLSLFWLLLSTPLTFLWSQLSFMIGSPEHIFHRFSLFPGKKEWAVCRCDCSAALCPSQDGSDSVRKKEREKGIESANVQLNEWDYQKPDDARIERSLYNMALADYSEWWWFVEAQIQMWIRVSRRDNIRGLCLTACTLIIYCTVQYRESLSLTGCLLFMRNCSCRHGHPDCKNITQKKGK